MKTKKIKSKIIIGAVCGIIACSLFYFINEWHCYKQKYSELQEVLKQSNSHFDILTPIDYMVLSNNGEDMYKKCNSFHSNYLFGNGYEDSTVFENGVFSHYVFGKNKDKVIPSRDYLLYCYIFALRDNNPYAAAEFVSYFLSAVEDGKAPIDSAMLTTTEKMAKYTLSITNEDCAISKWNAAYYLEKIYSGAYIKEFSNTDLEKQYRDSTIKYANVCY